MFLSLAELVALTGYKRRACMIRWLQTNGFVFRVAADGYPRVLADHVRTQLSGMGITRRNSPNLEALKQLQGVSHGTPPENSP
jgi:hypothetical protein